jgi:hypothetical protein
MVVNSVVMWILFCFNGKIKSFSYRLWLTITFVFFYESEWCFPCTSEFYFVLGVHCSIWVLVQAGSRLPRAAVPQFGFPSVGGLAGLIFAESTSSWFLLTLCLEFRPWIKASFRLSSLSFGWAGENRQGVLSRWSSSIWFHRSVSVVSPTRFFPLPIGSCSWSSQIVFPTLRACPGLEFDSAAGLSVSCSIFLEIPLLCSDFAARQLILLQLAFP